MPLDQVENFVEVNVSGTHSSTETIISLQSGEASDLPDPSSGEFNLVWFDSTNFSRPSEDNSVEIVRVTGRDTINDTITVLRGQENTTAVAHDTTNSDYVMILAQTAKMIEDVDSANFSTNSLTVANTTIGLGGSDTPEADNLAGNNGTSGQVLQTDGSNTSWADLESETVKTISSDFTTSGETTILIDQSESRYNLSNLSYTGNSFDVSNEDTFFQALIWNNDGTKMFVLGDENDRIYEYDVSTSFDVTSASYTGTSLDISNETGGSRNLVRNNTGSKFYVLDDDVVFQYDLTTDFDLSTASFSKSKSTTDISENFARGLNWNDDGSKMYIVGAGTDTIYEYDVSTSFDVGTATYNNTSFDVSNEDARPHQIIWNDDGSKMYIVGAGTDTIYEYDVSTSFDVGTATYNNTSLDVSAQTTEVTSGVWNDDGSKIYVTGDDNETIFSYTDEKVSLSLSTSDASQSGKIVRVKDKTGAAGANSVTIDTEGSETIDGSSSISLNTDYGVKQLQSDGTNWFVISDG